MKSLPDGIWPTTLTPFNFDGSVDYNGLHELIDFYIEHGSAGLFATCASSEILMLDPDEILAILGEITRHVQDQIPVVAGVPKFNSIQKQADFIHKLTDAGVDVAVLLACNFAEEDETDEIWIRGVDKLLGLIKNIKLGIYECPFPYHRILNLNTYKWITKTNRFMFYKDTSCDINSITNKIKISKKSNLSFFNAHTETLVDSLKLGGNGYSGVGTNLYPELYVWLIDNYKTLTALTSEITEFLINAEKSFSGSYPAFAKVFLKRRGLNISPKCRTKANCTKSDVAKVDDLFKLSMEYISNTLPTSSDNLKCYTSNAQNIGL